MSFGFNLIWPVCVSSQQTQPDHMTDPSPGSLISASDRMLQQTYAALLFNVPLQTKGEMTWKVLENSYMREVRLDLGGWYFLDLHSLLYRRIWFACLVCLIKSSLCNLPLLQNVHLIKSSSASFIFKTENKHPPYSDIFVITCDSLFM